MPSERELLEKLQGLGRDVYHLKRRQGISDEFLQSLVSGGGSSGGGGIAPVGAGPFPYDYYIDPLWSATGGAEGTVFTTVTGHTFKIYTLIKSAVDDANANRQASGQKTSFALSGGRHVCSATVSLQPPSLGGYFFYGLSLGSDAYDNLQDVIAGTGSTSPVFSLDTGVTNYGFYGLRFTSAQTSGSLVETGTLGVIATFDSCVFLNNAGSSATGLWILDSSNSLAYRITNCTFSGTGRGLRLATTFGAFKGLISDCKFLNSDFGIDADDAAEWTVSDCFFGLGDVGIRFGNTGFAQACLFSINSSIFLSDIGITFNNNTNPLFGVIIANNVFVCDDVDCDFSTSTGARSVGCSITNNVFWGIVGSPIGIRGHLTNLYNTIITGNQFIDFIPGTEIFNVVGGAQGNEAYHNISTSQIGLKTALADIGNPVGHGTSSSSSSSSGSTPVAHDPDTVLLSPSFTIDSTGIKTVTIPHGLGYTPAVKAIQLTVAENTAVDDWAFNLLKIVSVNGVNIVAKINVSTGSGTGGAIANLAVLVAGVTEVERLSMGWLQVNQRSDNPYVTRRKVRRDPGYFVRNLV